MAAINATSSSINSLQAVAAGRTRLEQARREADQAEANARNLRALAREAEREAQQSQDTVRDLTARVAQENTATYTARPVNKLAEVRPLEQKSATNPLLADPAPRTGNAITTTDLTRQHGSALNAQGQAIGRILNIRV